MIGAHVRIYGVQINGIESRSFYSFPPFSVLKGRDVCDGKWIIAIRTISESVDYCWGDRGQVSENLVKS